MKSGVDSRELQRVAKALKDAGEGGLGKQLNKTIRQSVKPIVEEMRDEVRALDSSSTSSGGSRARAAFAAEKVQKRRALTEKDLARAVKGAGLRDTIARAVTVVVRVTGNRPSVQVRVDGRKMPTDQRSLPRRMDSERGWRHPVFGTAAWVVQKANPAGWFFKTGKKHHARVRDEVETTIRDFASRIDERKARGF